MENSKYIVVEIFCSTMKMETPILFPACVGHEDMARSLGITPEDVLAAGFVEIYPRRNRQIRVAASGQSTSLKVTSRKEDSALIRKALNIAEIVE